jgi:hypothetical protein
MTAYGMRPMAYDVNHTPSHAYALRPAPYAF